MQALARKKNIEENPAEAQTAPAEEMTARISLRAVSALEVGSILISVIITSWAIIPLQPRQQWLMALPAIFALALMINSQRVRGESLRELGFGAEHFSSAIRLLAAPTLIACAGFSALGYLSGSFHRTSHFWVNALGTPLWALIQQYVLQAFIYRRVRFLLLDNSFAPYQQNKRTRLAILATAAIFSSAHAPNLSLMTLTFAGGLMWSWVYERAPNLFAIALSHAVISLMLMTSLPPWLLPSMSVGYKHFLYQKF
ncbi:MAG TPA: CPBP family intramembrane glutamic endopeptidase [Blastocatellia bacterium]|nr:CPBP family intramembrane glutamic endopeptidase [Blastocatellia bacterium]